LGITLLPINPFFCAWTTKNEICTPKSNIMIKTFFMGVLAMDWLQN